MIHRALVLNRFIHTTPAAMLNHSHIPMMNWELEDHNGSNTLVTNNSQAQYHRRTYNWPVLFFFLIVIAAIGGNILVCLAVKYERKLQNMFNFFLVSLVLSDMMSATLVVPLSIVKAFIGKKKTMYMLVSMPHIRRCSPHVN